MDEDEIQEAIEKRKLPLSIVDYLLLGFNIFIASFAITLVVISYNDHTFKNPNSMLFGVLFSLLLLTFVTWKIFHEKELIIYQNKFANDKKAAILEKLISQSHISSIQRKNNYYWLSVCDDERWGYYTVTLIYNESAYGICSLKGSGRSSTLSVDISLEIINKIKNLEAKV